MTTNKQTTDFAHAYGELEDIAARLKAGPVNLDELEALLSRTDSASAIIHERVKAVSRLVRRASGTRTP